VQTTDQRVQLGAIRHALIVSKEGGFRRGRIMSDQHLIKAKRYQRHAIECEELAVIAEAPVVRDYYRGLAVHYRRLAASEEELAHLNAGQRSRASAQP